MNFAMTQFSEVRRAGSSHPRLGRCPPHPGGGGSAQDAHMGGSSSNSSRPARTA